jgi:hypothetical protein
MISIMKRIFSLILILLLIPGSKSFAQNATIAIEHVTSCDSLEILISVDVENFLNIGAMSLDIAFDSAVLNYESLQNIHPQFLGIIANVVHWPQTKLGIIYTNMAGANLPSGKIFDIKFAYKNGQTGLNFLPSCDITSSGFEPIPTDYFNGSVKHLVTIAQQPQNQIVHQPEPAYFSVAVEGSPTYQWQQSFNNGAIWADLTNSANFTGVTTSELTITSTGVLFSGRQFRCVITIEGCVRNSDHALLSVLPPLIVQEINLNEGWNSLSTYLNPTETELDLLFSEINNDIIILLTDDLIYFPEGNINTIGNFNPENGYAIKLSQSNTLNISGTSQSNTSINLTSGWNYLPILADCAVTIEDLFAENIIHVNVIKEIAGLNLFWPENGISTLENLQPGRAYLINMNNPVELTFPDCN